MKQESGSVRLPVTTSVQRQFTREDVELLLLDAQTRAEEGRRRGRGGGRKRTNFAGPWLALFDETRAPTALAAAVPAVGAIGVAETSIDGDDDDDDDITHSCSNKCSIEQKVNLQKEDRYHSLEHSWHSSRWPDPKTLCDRQHLAERQAASIRSVDHHRRCSSSSCSSGSVETLLRVSACPCVHMCMCV